ncbi:aconitate hydratase [Simkania negevensis]|uniref:Putative aconitate hydratase 2 n=1 Tax=Simkania negevensis (strain ATCC VR-1471 / DSM 27360 / Z) TaxID=331113 RepID=F8L8G3_SIMNZ|nr:aconitate hydratase [Simkania negevensis]MCB1067170.1 aconitate hydratase [Simkania sp.]MCB1075277.1 aconitate hydratase [Simkania sp.]CCB89086.1 putative aconitate hydratase 2 [Simkania negevensis Z]
MGKNVAQKLLESHLVEGKMVVGQEIGLRIDQTLCQDATGTMVMLELEAMGLKRAKTEVSCQYVDHNIIQNDFKNPDDHLFLYSAAQKFGLWFSKAGNGVSHPVHMEKLGKPGKTLLGSDSHTCAGGSLGMLAMGTGGLEVALAIAGEPFHVKMPQIMGVKLTGKLPDWVSAKDVILEMLRRHDVAGGVGKIIEYYGPGLDNLSAMDRHVIANMGAELGATASVFPSDKETKRFMKLHGREADWVELKADPGCTYDLHDEIDLSKLEPLIACPSSPGNVVTVREVAGKPIFQAMIGSSANPGMRDFAIAGMIIEGQKSQDHVSLDINPTSRQILENLTSFGYLSSLIRAGGRIHQAGCNGCIGMGQAPATGKISLRTNPRNFPGRSGTKEDQVYLCSPETAIASAMTGKITDPRDLKMKYPKYKEPTKIELVDELTPPPAEGKGTSELIMGPNIKPLPKFDKLSQHIEGPTLLKMGNNISTDEILPAGTKVLPFRSNIPEISKFTLAQVDENYYDRAMKHQKTGSFLVGGHNYGQGSSREHAAIAPRYLGVKAVIAKSYARIHRQNLINFGILALTFSDEKDYDSIDQEDILEIKNVEENLAKGTEIEVINKTKGKTFKATHNFTPRELTSIKAGSLINVALEKHS